MTQFHAFLSKVCTRREHINLNISNNNNNNNNNNNKIYEKMKERKDKKPEKLKIA